MKWEDFFVLCYHPNPGHWIVHWICDSTPVEHKKTESRSDAERWISVNFRQLIDENFEKTIFLSK